MLFCDFDGDIWVFLNAKAISTLLQIFGGRKICKQRLKDIMLLETAVKWIIKVFFK